MNRQIIGFTIASVLGTACGTTALAASVPYTFSPGGIASAAEVNANFAALVAAVTALETKVGPQTTATLAGTYDYFELRIDVDDLGANSKSIAGTGTVGTVVLNANGTGQVDLSTSYRQLTFNAVTTADKTLVANFLDTPTTDSNAITWSFADGVVTIPSGGTFVVVDRLLIQSVLNQEGQNGIVILARR